MSTITRHQASGAYQPWQPPDFGAPREEEMALAEPAEDLIESEEKTPPPEPELEQDLDEPEFKLPTAEEIEEIYESSRKSGYDAGYEEGTARGRVEAMQLHGLVESLDQALQNFDGEVAEQMLDLAVELARHLLRRELKTLPETVLDTVREALQQFPQNNAMVHMHPQDAALVREYLSEQMAHMGHRIVEDDSITRGGCRIEASGSELDATLETRWKRIMANLGREDDLGDGD